jgi:pimeloyl-ACP methyl ester carboxylesterase
MNRANRADGWKSVDAERHFRTLEAELLAELAEHRPAQLDVPTEFGGAHAYHWPGRGEPVVMLHGATGTSLMWVHYADALFGRDIYAIDTIGDVGRSRCDTRPSDIDELARWLEQVLDGLRIPAAHLVATSYGGFLALILASRRPARVRSMYLVEPAALAPVRLGSFLRWGAAIALASKLPPRARAAAGRRLRTPMLDDTRLTRLVFFGQRHHRAQLLRPEPLDDPDLRAIDQPTRVVIGEESEAFDPDLVEARAMLLAHVAIERVPEAGHAVAMSHRDELTIDAAQFLGARSRPTVT